MSATEEEEVCSSWIVFNTILLVAAASVDRFRLVAFAAANRVTGMSGVHDQFLGLQQNRYDNTSCLKDIGKNLSSAGSTSNNHRFLSTIICGFGCASEFGKLVAG